jgi:hypothetical protein
VAFRPRNLLSDGTRLDQSESGPRNGFTQNDPIADSIFRGRRVSELHGKRIRSPRMDRLPKTRKQLELPLLSQVVELVKRLKIEVWTALRLR